MPTEACKTQIGTFEKLARSELAQRDLPLDEDLIRRLARMAKYLLIFTVGKAMILPGGPVNYFVSLTVRSYLGNDKEVAGLRNFTAEQLDAMLFYSCLHGHTPPPPK